MYCPEFCNNVQVPYQKGDIDLHTFWYGKIKLNYARYTKIAVEGTLSEATLNITMINELPANELRVKMSPIQHLNR